MVFFAVLVDELKVVSLDSNIGASVFEKHLLAVLAKYFGWFTLFFTVHALRVDRVSCNIFDVIRSSYILR